MPDPLSDVFSLVDLRSARCTRLEAGGRWAWRFPAKPALKFAAVLRGECWITLPGDPPCRLAAGDTFLLANAPPYVLANDPGRAPGDGLLLFDGARATTARHGGDDTVLVGGSFVVDGGSAQLLLDSLPTFFRVPSTAPAAAVLRATLRILDAELADAQVGRSLMTRRLADILLVQVLRAYAAEYGVAGAGWVGALTEPRIGAALGAMHRDPGRGWTVAELASAAGMSRSGFALRFTRLVGRPPLEYLRQWRMQRARALLRHRGVTVASLAAQLGYASESAFGHAFKRVFGRAPKRYWAGE